MNLPNPKRPHDLYFPCSLQAGTEPRHPSHQRLAQMTPRSSSEPAARTTRKGAQGGKGELLSVRKGRMTCISPVL